MHHRAIHLIAVITLLFLLSLRVGALAILIEATPGPNERTDTSPASIQLEFSEPIEPVFSVIRVNDLSGSEILTGGIVDPSDPFTLSLGVPTDLPDGVFTVSWRVFSAADGSTIQGSYAFGVGMAAGTRSSQFIDETIRPEVTIARWIDMLGAALTLGVVTFAFGVWRPGASQGLASRDDRFLALMRAGWAAAGAGILLGLLAQAATVTNGSILGSITDGSAVRILTDSSYAPIWIGRVMVWAVYGAVLATAPSRPALWSALFGLGIGLAVLPSLISHARALGSFDALINDMAHRTSAALWVGGLIAWISAIWPDLPLTAKPVSRAVTRFSNLARFYVMLLAAGGLFAAIQHIPSSDVLLSTAYGRALTVKGALFGLMFAIAAFNLLVVEKRLKRGADLWIPTLRLSVSAEMMLGAALMLMSAVMASTIPSRDVINLRGQSSQITRTSQGSLYFGMEIQDPVMMHFEVFPGVAGENEFIVSPYHLADTAPILDATRVRLLFTHLEQNLGESELDAVPDGSGNYTVSGPNLSLPGRWRVEITLQQPGEIDSVIAFEVTIPLP